MRLPAQPWLKIVFLATALVFLGVAAYLYGLRFFAWIDSDASVSAILAAKTIEARSPVVGDWYYASGDVWVLAPHLFAILPVALLGLGPASLLAGVASGFVVEVVAYAVLYARLCGERWVGLFAAMVTLMAWSQAHVAFIYIQLAYGFLTLLYVLAFGSFARLAASPSARPWRWGAAGLFLALVVVQSPTRGGVFVIAPLLAGCLWPWRGLALRRRLSLAAVAVAGWALAFAVYTWGLQRVASFSIPRGHIDFAVRDAAGIGANFEMLGRGLVLVCGGGDELDLRAIPGMAVLAGAIALVCRECLASRAFTAMRFFGVVVIALLGALLVPLIVGNLLITPSSVRYLMPALLAVFGLAAMLAVRTLAEGGATWWRRLAMGWLAAVPLAALVAAPTARPPEPSIHGWPDAVEHQQLGAELARRGLTHGFSSVLNANILNLMAGGAATTCPVFFTNVLVPQRWLADTSCYTAAALPDRFYVVADRDEREDASLRATLPAPAERFRVGDTYDVSVFRTAETPLAWLELPLPDGELARFPLRLPATHLQLRRGQVALEAGRMVATGEQGYVLYGPYMKLPAGHYDVRWTGSGIDSPGYLMFIVAADVGHEELTRVTVAARDLERARTELAHLSFEIGRSRDAVELTVFSQGGARVALDEVVIERR
ncbi:MAG TPA: hypothetical protein VN253_11115 [Kofleriaceae bacterium]|nr:hypothetical protein [Kofleriaceae bacterium]